MTTSYQVETGDPAIKQVLLKIGADHGWTGFPSFDQCGSWLTISKLSPKGGHNNRAIGDYTTLTILEFIALLTKGPVPRDPPIYIAGCEVKFLENGSISVGRYNIPRPKLDAIQSQLQTLADKATRQPANDPY